MPLPKEFEHVGLAWADADIYKLTSQFNAYGIPDYDNMAEPFIGHIFMSRPSLEVSNNLGTIKEMAQLHNIITDPFGRELALSLDSGAQQKWLPLITMRAKNYSVNDIELKSVEKINTFYGHTVSYSKHSEDHKMGGTVSIDFRNDRFYSILKLIYFWVFYIYNVSRNESIVVDPMNEEMGILDYCGSLYYVVTRTDNRRIVYWDKLVGVRPKKIPLSIFSWDDTTKVEDTVSVDFEYGLRSDPMDPAILVDINVLYNGGMKPDDALSQMRSKYVNYVHPNYQFNYTGVPFCNGPFISASVNNRSGTIEYFLEFR